MPNRTRLALELFLLFIAPPILMFCGMLPRAPFPYLLAGFIGSLVVLRRDGTFDQRTLLNWRARGLRPAVMEALALSVGVLVLGVLLEPASVLQFPLTRPGVSTNCGKTG